MKRKIFFFLTLCLFSACLQNELDIDYPTAKEGNPEIPENPDNPDDPQTKFKLEGEWVGTLVCPNCCDKDYDFTVTITTYNKKTNVVLGKIRVAPKSSSTIYAIYECIGVYQDDTLIIDTTKFIEREQGSCSFCQGNKYTITKKSDTLLEGTWTSSSCGSTANNSKIIIEKKEK